MITSPSKPEWVLQIHGGAGRLEPGAIRPEEEAAARSALMRALEAGGALLADGRAALDAVEAAVKILEDDPNFNAGKGAVFTAAETNELDAAIMDGAMLRAGAVANVTRSRNPISVARAVMEQTPHVMLIGEGADAFSKLHGLAQVEPSYFRVEERYAQLQSMKAKSAEGGSLFDKDVKFGTVGAVAMDRAGHLAAATSTGGLTGKMPGRVGDSAIIGAGTYADNRSCAVSATGSGEYYIREGAAHQICARIRLLGESAQQASDIVQAEIEALGGEGGVIVINHEGQTAWSFNTPGMYRGRWAAGQKPVVAVYGDE